MNGFHYDGQFYRVFNDGNWMALHDILMKHLGEPEHPFFLLHTRSGESERRVFLLSPSIPFQMVLDRSETDWPSADIQKGDSKFLSVEIVLTVGGGNALELG